MADEAASTATSEQTTEATAETAAAVETVETAGKEGNEASVKSEQTTEGTALGSGEGEKTEAEGAEAKAEVPESYELTPPEGFENLDADTVTAATPVFKELGLSNEQAQKLVPIAGEFAKKIIAEGNQQMLSSIATQRKEWLETAKSDAEIGGTNWDTSLSTAAKALDTLGFPKGSPLRNLLDESGLGNHPEMIRAFAKVGKAIGEDTDFVRGEGGAQVKKTDAELFYGSNKS